MRSKTKPIKKADLPSREIGFFFLFLSDPVFFPDQTGVRDRSDFRLMMLYVLSGRNSAGSEADNAG